MRTKTILTLHWSEIGRNHKKLLGDKCYWLASKKQEGFPVPDFFAIPNNVIGRVLETGKVGKDLQKALVKSTRRIGQDNNLQFGSEKKPLILAVRSGDPRSMYGALLTIPGVGLNDRTWQGLVNMFGPQSENAVLWLYLDLIVDFALRVEGIKKEQIAPLLEKMRNKSKENAELKEMINNALNLRRYYGVNFTFPQNVYDQLKEAVRAVAFSWLSKKAQCSAAVLGCEHLMPSVFVQQMVFSSLTPGSSFISLLTNPGPVGTYGPQTIGRRIMYGTDTKTFDLDELNTHDPTLYAKVMEIVDRAVRADRVPLNIEMVYDGTKLWVVQGGQAILSPLVQAEAINDLVNKGVLTEDEAVARSAKSQIENTVKVYKLNPSAKFDLVAEASSGVKGAMAGRLAFNADQAREFKKKKEKVIFLSVEPQDEYVYLLTLARKVDGIIATYGSGRGSHIVDFAQANCIPMVINLNKIEFTTEGVKIGGRIFKPGDKLIIEADEKIGRLFVSEDAVPLVEDHTRTILRVDVNFPELMRSIRNRYRNQPYERVLAEHAEGVKALMKMKKENANSVEIVELQARIHCLHLLAYEKGKSEHGKIKVEVDLDVAVADGNMSRVPGLEDEGLVLLSEKDKIEIIVGAVVEYEGMEISTGKISEEETKDLVNKAVNNGLAVEYLYESKKLSLHTQYQIVYGLRFSKDLLPKMVELLATIYKSKLS